MFFLHELEAETVFLGRLSTRKRIIWEELSKESKKDALMRVNSVGLFADKAVLRENSGPKFQLLIRYV